MAEQENVTLLRPPRRRVGDAASLGDFASSPSNRKPSLTASELLPAKPEPPRAYCVLTGVDSPLHTWSSVYRSSTTRRLCRP